MKYVVIAILAFLSVLIVQYFAKGTNAGEKSKVKTMIDAGALIVDVRTQGEFSGGHYPNAVNIPVDVISRRLGELGSKDREIVVYCHSGGRSAQAKQILEAAGFTKVVNGGGLSDMPR